MAGDTTKDDKIQPVEDDQDLLTEENEAEGLTGKGEITLRGLATFVEVAHTGSLAGAARKLFLAQSTVTARIQDLEDAVGTRLVVRRGRSGGTLTREGQRVLESAQEMLRLCGELRGDATSRVESSLTIATSSAPMRALVPELLERFSHKCTRCMVTVLTGSSDEVRSAVANGDAAIGLLGSATDRGNLEYRKIANDELVLVTPNTEEFQQAKKEGTLGRDLIGSAPLVARDAGSGTQRIVDSFLASLEETTGTRIERPRYRVASADLTLDLVELGMGISVASKMAAGSRLRDGNLLSFALDDPAVERPLYAALAHDTLLGTPAQVFLELLENLPAAKAANASK